MRNRICARPLFLAMLSVRVLYSVRRFTCRSCSLVLTVANVQRCPYLWCYLIESLSRFSLLRIACSSLSTIYPLFTIYIQYTYTYTYTYNIHIVTYRFCRGKSNQAVGPINGHMMFHKLYSIYVIYNFRIQNYFQKLVRTTCLSVSLDFYHVYSILLLK